MQGIKRTYRRIKRIARGKLKWQIREDLWVWQWRGMGIFQPPGALPALVYLSLYVCVCVRVLCGVRVSGLFVDDGQSVVCLFVVLLTSLPQATSSN